MHVSEDHCQTGGGRYGRRMREERDGDRRVLKWGALAGAMLLAACGGGESETSATTAASLEPASSTAPPVELENPAAQFCVDQGGTVFGPEPMCGLPDGTAVDAWEFYRSETTGETRPPSTTPTSTSAPAPTTSAAPSTTEAVVEVLAAEPTNLVFDNPADVPEFPIEVDGYTPYGVVVSSLVRVFETETTPATVYEFPGQMNTCEYGFWLARWSTGSDTQMYAANDVLYVGADAYDIDRGELSVPATAGLLSGFSCTQPGFVWAPPDADGNLLTDIAVEWQYYDRDWFEGTDEAASPPPDDPIATEGCDGNYVYDDELPISMCSEGFSVELFQEAMGLRADGLFGPGTAKAVRAYQEEAGLPVTGIMDAATWSALGVTEFAPFPDLNGDGVVDGSEFTAG